MSFEELAIVKLKKPNKKTILKIKRRKRIREVILAIHK